MLTCLISPVALSSHTDLSSQTKWAAEILVRRARRELSLDAVVFRPGMIGGAVLSEGRGGGGGGGAEGRGGLGPGGRGGGGVGGGGGVVVNAGDWLIRYLRGCLRARCWPPLRCSLSSSPP